jgi:hypothetical protein
VKSFSDIAQAHRFRVMQPLSARELAAVECLHAIVLETIEHPAQRPFSIDSHLPAHLIQSAQDVLTLYDCRIEPQPRLDDPDQTEREALDSAISDLVGLTP